MKALETVVLRYKTKDRIGFQYCAEFLRLTGIYVWEYLEDANRDKDNVPDDFGDAFVLHISELLQHSDGEEPTCDGLAFLEGLQSALQKEQEKEDTEYQMDALLETYPCILSVFKENDLLHAVTTLQYFRMNTKEVSDAAERFVKAAEELQKVSDENDSLSGNRHIRYAQLYCKQRANLGRWLCQQPLLELAEDLADECLELVKEFPDFSNAMVLRGLSYETSAKHSKEAVEAFNQAVIQVGRYPYASSIYYWIGKRCEIFKDMDKMQLTNEAYEYGYALEPKYRLCYKMAYISERWYHWEKADRYYMECLDYMRPKDDYLDPLEQLYCYKSAISAAYNCLAHLKDVQRAIDLLRGAEELRKNIISGKEKQNDYTRFYFDLYGEKAPEYISLEIGRMGPMQLYQYLAKAYQIKYQQVDALKYSDLFLKERRKAEEKKSQ